MAPRDPLTSRGHHLRPLRLLGADSSSSCANKDDKLSFSGYNLFCSIQFAGRRALGRPAAWPPVCSLGQNGRRQAGSSTRLRSAFGVERPRVELPVCRPLAVGRCALESFGRNHRGDLAKWAAALGRRICSGKRDASGRQLRWAWRVIVRRQLLFPSSSSPLANSLARSPVGTDAYSANNVNRWRRQRTATGGATAAC